MQKFKLKTSSIFLIISLFALVLVFYILSLLLSLPNVNSLKSCVTTTFNKVYLCPQSKNYSSLSNISKHLIDAILISEDASFFFHNGFEIYEIKESVKRNLKDIKFSRGGSTITQQLAKNAFLSSEKSIGRKLQEAYLTWQLERNFTKKQILEKYLNVIELGKDVYGVKQASKFYFHKSPSEITPIEAVYLAYLMPNPKQYSNTFHRKKLTPYAKSRMKNLLFKMYKYNKIGYYEHEAAVDRITDFFGTESAPVSNPKYFETDSVPANEQEEELLNEDDF